MLAILRLENDAEYAIIRYNLHVMYTIQAEDDAMIKDMTKGSPARLILGFALPMLAGMLFQQLYSFVDTMIVARFLGVNALAGVGATGSISFLVMGFCMGLCAGFAIPVAQRFGAGDERRMREFAANGVWLSVAFAAVGTVLTVVFCRAILTAMHTPQDCYEAAYRYIVVIFAGIPFSIMYNLLSGYLRSLGDSRTPLCILIFSSVLNVALDLLLILVFRLGVSGAALATVISQAVSGVLCLLWIVFRVPVLHVKRSEWRVRAVRMAELCACGVPMGLQYSITGVGGAVLQTATNSLGTTAVAAVAAANRVLCFVGVPLEALGSTMATYSAQNVGAGRYDRLNRGMLTALGMGFAYSACAFAVVWFFGRSITGVFISGAGEELFSFAQTYMLAETMFYSLLTLVNVVRFTIQGMGFSAFAVIAGALEMVARSLAGIFLVPAIGFHGVALGSPLAWIFADAFLIPAYFRCKKRLMGKMHHAKI